MSINIPSAIDVRGLYEQLGGESKLIDFDEFEGRVNMYVRILERTASRPSGVLRPSRNFSALNEMSKPQRQFFFKIGQWSEMPEEMSSKLTTDERRPTTICSYDPGQGIVTAWWREVFDPPQRRCDSQRDWDRPISAGAAELLAVAARALELGRDVSQAEVTKGFCRSRAERKNSSAQWLAFDDRFEAVSFVPQDSMRESLRSMGFDWNPETDSTAVEPTFILRSDPWQLSLGALAQEGFWRVGYVPSPEGDGPGVAAFHDGERMVAGFVERATVSAG